MNASLQAIKVFEAAARLGSFKDAAEELSITSANVSHHISNLENKLGVRLFTRINRGVILTSEGHQLSEATTAGLQKIQTALDNIKSDASKLNVDTTSSFAALVLIPLLHDFNKIHQNVDIEVSTGEVVASKVNTLSIRLGDVTRVDESNLLKKERFNLYGSCPFIRSITVDKPATVYLTKWKNKKLPDAPWENWLIENGASLPSFEIKYFDQELYGVYEAIAGKGLVFCSETLVSDFVKANALQPISYQGVDSLLCYYIPTQRWQHSAKMQAFVDWLKSIID
ncbi:LysR family transcriptional regulator [Vreelandella venusta]|uniref:LysR family transcriptional regulator n=1 Tax=Vreelandella venusta TaxID=44935 RepID=UPI00200F44FF|nr:LysR family transcriptional regulator [Halomonas venusta]UQI41621.1 LysR family transcriptional regulator [Halomonas venusta]